jgi:hypothetical protein
MYLLEVEPLDLGPDVKAISLELIDADNREPVRGADAAGIWSRVLRAAAVNEPWALDFFSHIPRVTCYCERHQLPFRKAAERCIVISPPEGAALAALLQRFEGETFGVRAGGLLAQTDAGLEADLSRRGVDAYHHCYAHYFFCGVCDFENGFLTLLTDRLWAGELIRRVRPALRDLNVEVLIPQ